MPSQPDREVGSPAVGCYSAEGAEFGAFFVPSAEELPDSLWSMARPSTTRARLTDLERDPRFDASFVLATMDDEPVLALPAYAPLVGQWPDPGYDVPALLALANPSPATGFCLLGGRADLRCEVLRAVDPDGPDDWRLNAAAALAVATARDAAAESGRRCALLYVDADEGLLHRAAMSAGVESSKLLGDRYVIPDVGEDLPGYLSRLSGSRRGIVRRDLQKLGKAGLRAEVCDWSSVLDEGAPLIAAVKAQHQLADVPALIHHRLSRRALDPDVKCVAFATRQDGRLTAVTTGWIYGSTLELYEVGLVAEPSEDRGLRYLEVMFYAPLRFMWSLGLRSLDLALSSAYPKTLRGAVGRPLAGLLLAAS